MVDLLATPARSGSLQGTGHAQQRTLTWHVWQEFGHFQGLCLAPHPSKASSESGGRGSAGPTALYTGATADASKLQRDPKGLTCQVGLSGRHLEPGATQDRLPRSRNWPRGRLQVTKPGMTEGPNLTVAQKSRGAQGPCMRNCKSWSRSNVSSLAAPPQGLPSRVGNWLRLAACLRHEGLQGSVKHAEPPAWELASAQDTRALMGLLMLLCASRRGKAHINSSSQAPLPSLTLANSEAPSASANTSCKPDIVSAPHAPRRKSTRRYG